MIFNKKGAKSSMQLRNRLVVFSILTINLFCSYIFSTQPPHQTQKEITAAKNVVGQYIAHLQQHINLLNNPHFANLTKDDFTLVSRDSLEQFYFSDNADMRSLVSIVSRDLPPDVQNFCIALKIDEQSKTIGMVSIPLKKSDAHFEIADGTNCSLYHFQDDHAQIKFGAQDNFEVENSINTAVTKQQPSLFHYLEDFISRHTITPPDRDPALKVWSESFKQLETTPPEFKKWSPEQQDNWLMWQAAGLIIKSKYPYLVFSGNGAIPEKLVKEFQAIQQALTDYLAKKRAYETLKHVDTAQASYNKELLQQLLLDFTSQADRAVACGDHEGAQIYQNRIKAIENTFKNPHAQLHFSDEFDEFIQQHNPYAHLFKNCSGSPLEQQLHNELCQSIRIISQLAQEHPTFTHVQLLTPFIYRITAVAKQECDQQKAFNLSDASYDLIRIASRGVDLLARGTLAAGKGIASGITTSLDPHHLVETGKNLVSPSHWLELSKNLLSLGIFLADEYAQLEDLDRAFFTSLVSGDDKPLLEQGEAYHQRCQNQIQHLKAMSWESFIESGFHLGTTFVLDGLVLKAATLCASATGRSLIRTMAEAIKSPRATESIIEVAGVGKIALDEGIETTKILIQDTEFIRSDLLEESICDRLKNFISKLKNRSIEKKIQTGAKEISVKEFLAEEEWAKQQYEFIRRNTNDVQMIVNNTGFPEHKIKRIKEHLFYDNHVLDIGTQKLFPSKNIAKAWHRLIKGDFTIDDLKLLEHEYFEAKFETIFKTTNRVAHNKARQRRPSPLEKN